MRGVLTARCRRRSPARRNEVSPSHVINCSTYLPRPKPGSMDYIGTEHLGLVWPTGGMIRTTWTQSGPSPHLRSISSQAFSPPALNAVMAATSRLQKLHLPSLRSHLEYAACFYVGFGSRFCNLTVNQGISGVLESDACETVLQCPL